MIIEGDCKTTDEALELAARLIEGMSLTDFRGMNARRKRDREDAALRVETIRQTREECARHIRAFINRPDLEPLAVLRHVAEEQTSQHSAWLTDAWPLAWKGWVNIEATIVCNSNRLPPETRYRIVLTDAGREALATAPSSVPTPEALETEDAPAGPSGNP
jgi:hypothetical protein